MSGDDHYLDALDRRMTLLKKRLADHGFDFSRWAENGMTGSSFEFEFAEAALAIMDKLDGRIAALEEKLG